MSKTLHIAFCATALLLIVSAPHGEKRPPAGLRTAFELIAKKSGKALEETIGPAGAVAALQNA